MENMGGTVVHRLEILPIETVETCLASGGLLQNVRSLDGQRAHRQPSRREVEEFEWHPAQIRVAYPPLYRSLRLS